MARTLELYPQASIEAATWTYRLEIADSVSSVTERFAHTIPAGVITDGSLSLLKIVFDVVVDDADTGQDVDDALFVDDIQPGSKTRTVWETWQTIAEGIIDGLAIGYTERDFWAAWMTGNTQAMRNAVNRALVSGPGSIGRGWQITSVHQHEGDGSVSELGI